MSRDNLESALNAAIGYLVAIALVSLLRDAGLWSTLPPWVVPALFLGASWTRSRALRWAFRRCEQ